MNLLYEKLYIGGQWVRPATSNVIKVVSASTEQPLGQVPDGSEADMDAAVSAARRAFDDPTGWAHLDPADRGLILERFAAELESRSAERVQRVSAQNGMPVSVGAPSEGAAPPILLRYYLGLMGELPTEEVRNGLFRGTTAIRREPIGVVAAIVPWNFPQSLAFMKLAPALAAGCTVVLKPSPETVLDAYLVAEAAEAAGLPAGVLNIVAGGREVGAYLVAHPGVDKVSFTGSSAAGRHVGEVCGRLLRPVTLELGGKSAAIVLDDADLAPDLDKFFAATMRNSGQTCYLGTRVLAPRSRYDEVVGLLVSMVGSLKIGDALDPDTQLGPLSSARQRDRVEEYIAKGLGDGAKLVAGGGRPADLDRGWFVEPTIFANVDNRSIIAQEEIFGPVLSVIPYTNVDDAVSIANDSDYGLGGSVWSADSDRAMAVARRVQTGSIGINSYDMDIGSPFGGVKASGLGHELGSEGLAANQVIKSIYRQF